MTHDVAEQPHRATEYRVLTALVEPELTACTWLECDESGSCVLVDGLCLGYTRPEFAPAFTVLDPGPGFATVCTWSDVADPPLGSVVWYQVVACYGDVCGA